MSVNNMPYNHGRSNNLQGRVPELIENLKQEYDTMSHDLNVFKLQRDEYERKLQAQLTELTNVQQTLIDLERNHNKLKQQYEEEILRLRRQLENGGTGGGTFGADGSTSLDKIEPEGTSLPSLTPLSEHNTKKKTNGKKEIIENPLQLPSLGSNNTPQELGSGPAPMETTIPHQTPNNNNNNTPAAQNPEQTAAKNFPESGPDWIVGYNPGVPTNIHINLKHNLSHKSVVCCVKFSQDGNYLATGCNKSAQIYEVETGRKVHTFSQETTRGADLYIRSVCFSPDGKYLATGAEDKTVKLWNIENNNLVHTFEEHDLDIYSVDYSQDGRFIVSGSGDKKAKIWDIEQRTCVHTLGNDEVGPKDGVTSVAISPDGRLVAAGSLDRIVRVWDAETGYFLERFEGHFDSVYSVAFSPDGKSLASGSLDKTLKIWDLSGTRARSRCRLTLNGHKDFVLSVAFSSDGNWLVSGSKDRSVQFWDPRNAVTHTMLQGHKNSVISVALSPSGRAFATGSGDFRARIWNYE